jgi:uncharacterized cupredoxin-like copper-binding protein
LLVNGIRSAVGCTALALTAFTLGACSSDSGETVNVTAADFSLKPDVSSVPAGTVKFKVKNTGGFGHEMVVVKVADAKDLPTEPNGEVDEAKIPKADQIGEVEDILPDQTKTLKVDLEPGKYVLFCNRVDGTTTIHFKKGMHADFTVTPAK